jgi:hypothetical protein
LIRALTERIVLVLSRMKCAYNIEPHQIQGGDFIHIFPVVQWLVKRVFDRRTEIGDLNRAYTLHQYEKQFNRIINEDKHQQTTSLKQNVEAIRVTISIIIKIHLKKYIFLDSPST